jgi:hypothetical protein
MFINPLLVVIYNFTICSSSTITSLQSISDQRQAGTTGFTSWQHYLNFFEVCVSNTWYIRLVALANISSQRLNNGIAALHHKCKLLLVVVNGSNW